ncbi:hypothetical protein NN561_017476 [Cricetulus griseus]
MKGKQGGGSAPAALWPPPVSLALEAAPRSQLLDKQHRCSASPSSSSPSRRRPRCTLQSLAAPWPCPAQSPPRCHRSTAPDSYPTLGGPSGSAADAHRDDLPGYFAPEAGGPGSPGREPG